MPAAQQVLCTTRNDIEKHKRSTRHTKLELRKTSEAVQNGTARNASNHGISVGSFAVPALVCPGQQYTLPAVALTNDGASTVTLLSCSLKPQPPGITIRSAPASDVYLYPGDSVYFAVSLRPPALGWYRALLVAEFEGDSGDTFTATRKLEFRCGRLPRSSNERNQVSTLANQSSVNLTSRRNAG